jgi:serine protease Do
MGLGLDALQKLFRAFLPGSAEAVPLKILTIASNADAALLHGTLGRSQPPALELDRTGKEAVPGRAVILLGYPAGIEALLAKADIAAARELIMGDVPDMYRLAEVMAARRMIRPSATQGRLGDVQPHQLVYDAQTAIGGSGGPLLTRSGRVVGISYGVMGGFAGSNFGVPIRFGLDLLEKATPR